VSRKGGELRIRNTSKYNILVEFRDLTFAFHEPAASAADLKFLRRKRCTTSRNFKFSALVGGECQIHSTGASGQGDKRAIDP
jgi:hypothetical protein